MALPSSQILPSSAFRHIGIMVLFMSIMASFCALGFISVNDITKGWLIDVDHSLTIEIPPYDENTKTVYSDTELKNHLDIIKKDLSSDPIIEHINIETTDAFNLENQDKFKIPDPIFITISLNPKRAINAENRLAKSIQQKVPQAVIKSADEWDREISKTAMILQLVFSGLALSVFIVTSIILSGIVKSQINANKTTIELIHMIGAPTPKIAMLFKSSVLKPTLWGLLIGLVIACVSLSPLINLLGLGNNNLIQFYYYITGIFISFIILTRVMTHITVLTTLRQLP